MDGLPSIASVGTENMSKYNDISHIREVPRCDPVDSTHSTHKHFYWKFQYSFLCLFDTTRFWANMDGRR